MKNIRLLPAKGGCERIVNVRECDGVLKSVGDWSVMCSVEDDARLLLIDRRREGDFFLLGDSNCVRVCGVRRQGVFSELNQDVYETDGEVLWAQSIGEFVAIGTTAGIRYLRYDAESYSMLNFDEIAPQLVFEAVNVTELSERVPAIEFDEPYSKWERLSEKDRLILTDAVTDACKSIDEQAKQRGGFVQPVMVRYAVRLQDDNYAWISAPVAVGCGILLRHRVSASVDNSMTLAEESELKVNFYNIGVTVVKPLNEQWRKLVKSVDVLVSDEMMPYINGNVRSRCEYSAPNRTLTYWLEAKDSFVARSEIVNPAKWTVIARFADFENGTSVLRSKMYNTGVGKDEVARITKNISREVIANAELTCGGRLYAAGITQKSKNTWKSVQYWNGDMKNVPCEVIIVAKLRTANGEAVKVNRESYDFTPEKLNAMIAYPDARAVELGIKILSENRVTEWTGKLSGCDEQGFAYFLSNDIKPIELNNGVAFYEPTETNIEEQRLNEVIVSAVANPFVSAQSRTVGQSEALALAKVQKSIYSSTFGRYPVYVFTREGIFALSYKEKGDYSDAQLVDIRTVNNSRAITMGEGRIYFVSQKGVLCELIGKDVKELSRIPNIVKLAWADREKELFAVFENGVVKVMQSSGCWINRNEGIKYIYSDYHDAIVQDFAGNMIDANEECDAEKTICVETSPIEVGDNLIAPMLLKVNVSGSFAEDSELLLLGSDAENSEWRVLSKVILDGTTDKEIRYRIYASPCRMLKAVIEAETKGTVIIRNVAVTYNE